MIGPGHALGLTGLGLDTCPLSNGLYGVVVEDLWKPAWSKSPLAKTDQVVLRLHIHSRVRGHLSAGLFKLPYLPAEVLSPQDPRIWLYLEMGSLQD